MPFPSNPNDGDAYGDYYYDASEGAWRKAGTLNNINIDDIIFESPDEFDVPPTSTARVLDVEGGTLDLNDGTVPQLKEVMRVPGTFGNSAHWDYAFMRQTPFEEVNNLIANGDCESVTPPAWVGQTGIANSATFVRSSEQVFEGNYSYKFTTNSTTSCTWGFVDTTNSFNGLDRGDIIRFELMAYVPSGQTGVAYPVYLNGSSFIIANRWDFSGSPRYDTSIVLEADRWEKLVLYFQVPWLEEFTGWRPYLQISGLAAGTHMYVDQIRAWKLEFSRPSLYFERQDNSSFSNNYQDLTGNFWVTSSSYHSDKRIEYDEEMDAPVHVWNKGSTSNATYIYQNAGQSMTATEWTMSFWYKCNYPTRTSSYVYGPNVRGAYSYVPANKWTRVSSHVGTGSAGTGFQLGVFQMQDGTSAFPSDIEFRATEPFVNTIYSHAIKLPNTTVVAPTPLELNENFPPVGTFMCWIKPGFLYNRSGNIAVLGDYVGGSRYVYFFYAAGLDTWDIDVGTQTTFLSYSAYTRNSRLQQWQHLAFTWDTNNHEYALYRNGQRVSESTANTGPYDPQGIISIGGLTGITDPTVYYITSAMADILLDETVWDYQQIRDHYNVGKPWKYKDKPFTFDRLYRDSEGQVKQITHSNALIGGRQWRSH